MIMKKLALLFLMLISFTCSAHADALFASGVFTLNSSTGNQSITGTGFQPKLVLFWADTGAASASVHRTGGVVFGAATGSTSRWASATQNTWGFSMPSTFASKSFSSSLCFLDILYSGSTTASADFVSMDANGFTINVTKGASVRVYWMAFGGSDVSASVGTWSSGTGTGSKSITGVGFRPNFIWLDNTNSGGNLAFAVGAANNGNQTFSKGSDITFNGSSSTAHSYQVNNTAVSVTSGGSLVTSATLTSFDSNGVTLNFTSNASSSNYGYIAMSGLQTYIGTITQKTSTGTQAYTGFGFRPSAVLTTNSASVSSASIITNYRMSIGGSTGSSNNYCSAGGETNNVSTSLGAGLSTEVGMVCAVNPAGGNPATLVIAKVTSFDSNGMTLNYTTANATAAEVEVVAFAPSSTPTGNTTFTGSKLNGTTIY